MRTLVRATIALSAAVVALGCGSKSSGPTDTPTATLYGYGAYPWAETMVNWTCVYSIADFPGEVPGRVHKRRAYPPPPLPLSGAGSNDDARFAAAQAAAVAGGGGVVYFPSGAYTFTRNLTLASNVVIRGTPTTAPAKKGTQPGPLAPSTVFNCPPRQHIGECRAKERRGRGDGDVRTLPPCRPDLAARTLGLSPLHIGKHPGTRTHGAAQ